jgi:ABC-type sulfate transport system substrate-binding protein
MISPPCPLVDWVLAKSTRRVARAFENFRAATRAVQINERAYLNPEEFIGIPQNPRRISAGIEVRLP